MVFLAVLCMWWLDQWLGPGWFFSSPTSFLSFLLVKEYMCTFIFFIQFNPYFFLFGLFLFFLLIFLFYFIPHHLVWFYLNLKFDPYSFIFLFLSLSWLNFVFNSTNQHFISYYFCIKFSLHYFNCHLFCSWGFFYDILFLISYFRISGSWLVVTGFLS